jgi:tRNA (Thr-GGU) A37 N-methylase
MQISNTYLFEAQRPGNAGVFAKFSTGRPNEKPKNVGFVILGR